MSSSAYGGAGVADHTRTLFGQVMWYVAATAGLFALGSYSAATSETAGRSMFFILALVCVIGMQFAIRSSAGLTVALLFGMGCCWDWGCRPRCVLRQRGSASALGGRWSDSAVHRRLWRIRLRDPQRSVPASRGFSSGRCLRSSCSASC